MSLSRRQLFQAPLNPGGRRGAGPAGTSQGAQVVLADDNGANNHLWRFL